MKTSNISWSILAAAGLVVTSLVLASCSTCPAVQKDSIEQSKQEQIKKLLTADEWQTNHCLQYTKDKGKTDKKTACMNQMGNRRWIFKENGQGSFQEKAFGATEWVEFSWKLDGDVLKLEQNDEPSTYEFKILSYDESEIEFQRESCSVSVLKPYEA